MSVETELGQTDDDATDLTAEAETDWLDTQWSFCLGLCAGLLFPLQPASDPWLDRDALRDVTMEEFIHSGNFLQVFMFNHLKAVRFYQF